MFFNHNYLISPAHVLFFRYWFRFYFHPRFLHYSRQRIIFRNIVLVLFSCPIGNRFLFFRPRLTFNKLNTSILAA